jgi:hypothetical protein
MTRLCIRYGARFYAPVQQRGKDVLFTRCHAQRVPCCKLAAPACVSAHMSALPGRRIHLAARPAPQFAFNLSCMLYKSSHGRLSAFQNTRVTLASGLLA